ncbi:MAG TPA: hypothetical protein VG816_01050 [Solirubrobacterales bacterium]|nr:hypothetical protein [Solirubrobacterales bacterium]
MNRKLDVGSTLSQIFSTYGQQAGVLLPLAFGIFLLVAIITALLSGNVFLSLIAFAVSVVAGTLYQGMVVSLVRDVQDGTRDSSVGQLVEETWPVVLPLIGAGILAGIGIAIGFVLIIVPGLILLTIWSVIAPVIVVEHSGAIDAFGRSRQLVKGNGWQVFGVIVVVFLIAAIASFVLRAIGASISDSFAMLALFGLIASTVTAPITALAASVIYFNLLPLQAEPAVTEPGAASDAPLPPSPA